MENENLEQLDQSALEELHKKAKDRESEIHNEICRRSVLIYNERKAFRELVVKTMAKPDEVLYFTNQTRHCIGIDPSGSMHIYMKLSSIKFDYYSKLCLCYEFMLRDIKTDKFVLHDFLGMELDKEDPPVPIEFIRFVRTGFEDCFVIKLDKQKNQ